MTKKVSYDEVSVAKSLNKKTEISINTNIKRINVKKNATNVGNGTWGKIDYLCKVHGYHYFFADNVGKSTRDIRDDNENNDIVSKKVAKRQAKLNMAAATKAVMHKIRK